MDLLWYRYYKVNRIFLLPLGLWPHGSRKLKPIQAIFFNGLLVSSVVTQLMKIFTTEINFDSLLVVLSFTIPATIYIIKFSSFYFQAKRLRRLMELIYYDWNLLRGEEEILIIQKYTITARRFTVAFASLIYLATMCFILYQYMPNILDFVAPLNESRPRYHPFQAEYLVDQEKYFDTILVHMVIVTIVGVSTFVGTETMCSAYIYHACGMLKIVSYRLKHVLDEDTIPNSKTEWNVYVRGRIIAAVEVHRRAIQFFDYYNGTFRLSNFGILSLGVASLSINLFRAAKLQVKTEDDILMAVFVFCQFYYMFVYSYIVQNIIDHSTDIFREIYNIAWYEMSVPSQKLLLFMMQRSMRNCRMLLGGIFSVSLEGVTTITSMSVSYFTVLCSTR